MTDLFVQGAAELAEDAQRLLVDIDQEVPGAAAATADCRPPLDVIETATAVEVVMDVPGVPPESLRVIVRRSTLLVVGTKGVSPVDGQARFHLAERGHGRFARAVRLAGAFDATGAQATLRAGQLRVTLPRIEDRRGRLLSIPVRRS